MPEHVVRQGDCIHSISANSGFFWETIWNHGGNAALRSQRGDPSVLAPGDVVAIPEKETKQENAATEQKHRYRKKGTPAKVKIQILRNDEPRANEPVVWIIDGRTQETSTDGDGFVEMRVPPDAVQGELRVGREGDVEIHHFRLGSLDPIDSEKGGRDRLACLGYDATQPLDQLLREFQAAEGIEETGRLDDTTQGKLRERFGE